MAPGTPRVARKAPVTASTPGGDDLEVELTSEIEDNLVACDCEDADGRPADGEQGVVCTICNNWHHKVCMLGKNYTFTKADYKKGFKCRVCRQRRRSEAAQRGYEKLHGSGSTKSTPAKRPRLTSSSTPHNKSGSSAPRKSALSLPPRGTQRDKPLSKGVPKSLFDGIPSERESLTRGVKRKLNYFDDESEDEDEAETEDMFDDENAASEDDGPSDTPVQDTPSKDMTRAQDATSTSEIQPEATPPPAKGLTAIIEQWKKDMPQPAASKRTIRDVFEEWKRSTPSNTVYCLCAGGPPDSIYEYIICRGCQSLQHRGCKDVGKSQEDGLDRLCVRCGSIHQKRLALKRKMRKNRLCKVAMQQQQAVLNFTNSVLWKLYCELPKGESNAKVIEQSSMKWDEKSMRMLPANQPPQQWTTAVYGGLVFMTTQAGHEKLQEFRGPDGTQLKYSSECMVGWRNLAVWMLHHGPFKMHGKKTLGVWGEVLGLEEKGHYYKG
ncbi:hypothetical protein KC318_g9370 [Hortaea werneckii]|uniref:Zinc finger PHD-type domain-containing protein n=1 Tax=Hortaea werneckii TaxID=91943 RepID=A0A3M6YBK9_HORWE|nr:hypothetical protein KC334_g4868 [Hortaea werneckii]KAI7661575.1 hypothetical protein KC318_g9370 [Hortaea werneckii]RMY00187.1 hypothetical protein D0867_11833 [Hortaea werneckii]RMY34728.1 hypothetical protein D0866_05072 [Hortaea werneckii]